MATTKPKPKPKPKPLITKKALNKALDLLAGLRGEVVCNLESARKCHRGAFQRRLKHIDEIVETLKPKQKEDA